MHKAGVVDLFLPLAVGFGMYILLASVALRYNFLFLGASTDIIRLSKVLRIYIFLLFYTGSKSK